MKTKAQLDDIREWYTSVHNLPPGDQIVRELFLMSWIIEQDFTQDGTRNEDDRKLLKVARKLRKQARSLHRVLEDIDYSTARKEE